MQQRRFAGIIETKEEKFGMLVQQAERGKDIIN
jgi:hypothetical protein